MRIVQVLGVCFAATLALGAGTASAQPVPAPAFSSTDRDYQEARADRPEVAATVEQHHDPAQQMRDREQQRDMLKLRRPLRRDGLAFLVFRGPDVEEQGLHDAIAVARVVAPMHPTEAVSPYLFNPKHGFALNEKV